jgi:biotin carboxylase
MVVPTKNSNDLDEVLQVVQDQVGTVDAVLTFAEIRTQVAARLCRKMGLRGANVEAVEIAQDKHRFRKVLVDRGADTVKCRRIDNIEMLRTLKAETANFPCFIKPVQGHSSIGAVACQSPDEVDQIIAALGHITEDWISPSFVVEDYLRGDLVSVEVLTTSAGRHQIVGVADRDVIKDSIETGSSFPLTSELRDQVVQKACRALDAIGYDFGPSHIEIIVTDTGPHLVEVNTRVGGSGHSIMLDLSTARSIVGDCIELCLGNLPQADPLYTSRRGAAWKCFVSDAAGVILNAPSFDQIKSKPGVEEVWFHHEPGDEVNGLDSNFSWIVQVMCVGKDRQEAKLNAARAIDFVAQNTLIGPKAAL